MGEQAHRKGTDVPVSAPPRTVVSLVPSVTESLFDLNLGGRLVGITDYCIHPEAGVRRLPRIGGTKNPDVARIVALQPDLVIANREENRGQDIAALQDAGIQVWVTFPKTVREAINLLWQMMSAFEESSMAPRVRLIEQMLDWLERMSAAREDAGELARVFVPIWLDPLMSFNAETYVHDLLYSCGGLNVFAGRQRRYPLKADLGEAEPYPGDDPRVAGLDRRYPRLTMDEVVAAQPEVILLPSEPYAFTEAHVPLFAALDVPAARNGRILPVDGTLLTWHGTRLAHALEILPGLLNQTAG